MLKVKSVETKKGSTLKASKGAVGKANKVAKKSNQAKQLKEKQGAKVIKKAVKAPTAASAKAGDSLVKKVPGGAALFAKQKKLKKIGGKEATISENGQESSAIEKADKLQQNGTKTETADKVAVAPKPADKTKNKNKKKPNTEIKEKTGGPPGSPAQTVFVGNLPTNTKRIQLVKLFNRFGPILGIRFRTASGKVIFKHKTRKESGALNAYIILKDEESAAKALELNGHDFKGNHIRVTKTDKPEADVDSKRMIFVGNLKYSATDEKLHQIFSSCGEIEYVRTLQDPNKSGCKGVAFICFKNPDSVGLALELKGTVLDERPIHVERYSVNKLGAKVKRDSENEKTKGQAPTKGKKDAGAKKNITKADDNDGKKKKSEFRGVKTDLNKKKQKKKIPSEMKKLAKKIAPKGAE